MEKRIVLSGFGGQGVLSLGIIISELALAKDLNVSWIPSYGAEMRGGTANCSVVYSDSLIGSPVVNDEADVVVCMNNPSLAKFESYLKPGGLLLLDSAVVTNEPKRKDINVATVNCTDFAVELGAAKVANMVMLGEFIRQTRDFEMSDAEAMIQTKFATKTDLIPLNIKAINYTK